MILFDARTAPQVYRFTCAGSRKSWKSRSAESTRNRAGL